jgi:hypothetical protein
MHSSWIYIKWTFRSIIFDITLEFIRIYLIQGTIRRLLARYISGFLKQFRNVGEDKIRIRQETLGME